MVLDHTGDDGEAEARADGGAARLAALEAFEDCMLFCIGNSRAAIANGQRQGRRTGTARDLDAVGGIDQGVIDEVPDHLAQGDAIAAQGRAFEVGGEIDNDAAGLFGVEPLAHVLDDGGQGGHLGFLIFHAMGNRRFHEKLADELAGMNRLLMNAPHAAAQGRRVFFIHGDFGLGAQRGERGAHLMGGFGHKAGDAGHGIPQAGHKAIERRNELADFFGHGNGDGGKIVRRASLELMFELGQRGEHARDTEPHKPDGQKCQRNDRDDGVGEDFIGQGFALVLGFGHVNGDPAGVVGGGNKASDAGHPHGFAAILGVDEAGLGGKGFGHEPGEVGIAGHGARFGVLDGVIDPVLAREHRERSEGEFDHDALILHLHGARDGERGGGKEPVEGSVGGSIGVVANEDHQNDGGGQQQAGRQGDDAAMDRERPFGEKESRAHGDWVRMR